MSHIFPKRSQTSSICQLKLHGKNMVSHTMVLTTSTLGQICPLWEPDLSKIWSILSLFGDRPKWEIWPQTSNFVPSGAGLRPARPLNLSLLGTIHLWGTPGVLLYPMEVQLYCYMTLLRHPWLSKFKFRVTNPSLLFSSQPHIYIMCLVP